MKVYKKGKHFYFMFTYRKDIVEEFRRQKCLWDRLHQCWKCHEDNLRGLVILFQKYKWECMDRETYIAKQRLLEEPEDRKALSHFIENILPTCPDIKYHFKTKPMRHQSEALMVLQRAGGREALFFDMGTGKSKIALDYLTMTGKRGIIVAPKSVILGSWIKEVEKHSFLNAVFLLGPKQKRLKLLKQPADVYIINYEGVLVLEEELEKIIDKNTVIILDESIRIKNPNAKITKALMRLGKLTNNKIIMTGLPATKGYVDLFSQLKFLDCYMMPKSLTQFRNRYCIMGGFENREIVDYKNTEELEEALKLYGFQKKREECLDLPPKVYEKIVVEPNKKLEKLIKAVRNQKLEDTSMINVRNKLITLRRLSGGMLEGEVIDNGKLKVIEELLEQHDKLVVWASFRDEAEYLFKSLEKYNPVLVWGQMKNEDVTEAVNSFQNNPEVKVFIGIPAAVKYGVTLTSANVAVYYSNDFSLDNRLQSEDRIYRKGQDKKVVIIDLVMKGGVDDFILMNLNNKKTEAEIIREWLTLEEKVEF